MPSSFRALPCLVLFLWLALLGDAGACLWLRGTTIDGRDVASEEDHLTGLNGPNLQSKMDDLPHERKLEIFWQFAASTDPIDGSSDAAVEVLMDGNPKKAVTMLETLEKEHPGRYYTAANLGTAYELSGDDEKALHWILEGIRRNPDSHMRTEWLHARILETKIKLKTNPNWLENHTITEADFLQLQDPKYRLQTRQRPVSARDLHRCLWIQLEVRMLFVKPQDPIVAQLLQELAVVEASTGILENATTYLDMAEQYGASSAKTAPLKGEWARIIWWSAAKRDALTALKVAGLLAIFLAAAWAMFLVIRNAVRHGH